MNLLRWRLGALSLSVLAAACSSTTSSVAVEDGEADASVATPESGEAYAEVPRSFEPEGEAYTLVILRAADELYVPSREELQAISKGHAAFMDELDYDGYLLARGPLVPPRFDPELRTLYLVDSADPVAVQDRGCADPAVEAGLFRMETMAFVTRTDLGDLAGLARASRIQRGSNAMRPYVIVGAPSSAAMSAMFEQMSGAVLFYGHCTSGTFAGQTLAVLDATTVEQARETLRVLGPEADAFSYHAWVASVAVSELD